MKHYSFLLTLSLLGVCLLSWSFMSGIDSTLFGVSTTYAATGVVQNTVASGTTATTLSGTTLRTYSGSILTATGGIIGINDVALGWFLPKNQLSMLNVWSECKNVQSPSGYDLFVPTRSSSEWSAFKIGAPQVGATLSDCVIYTYTWQQSGFGACSLSCGGGTQTRTVICQRDDGVTVTDGYCTGVKPTPESQSCNTQACPVNCSYTTTGWGACSASCGGGNQSYYYTITSPARNGGTCPVSEGQVAGTQSCNTQACVISCTSLGYTTNSFVQVFGNPSWNIPPDVNAYGAGWAKIGSNRNGTVWQCIGT